MHGLRELAGDKLGFLYADPHTKLYRLILSNTLVVRALIAVYRDFAKPTVNFQMKKKHTVTTDYKHHTEP